jgi:hypothetical protein
MWWKHILFFGWMQDWMFHHEQVLYSKNNIGSMMSWQFAPILLLNICYGMIAIHIISTTCRFCGNIFLWRKKIEKQFILHLLWTYENIIQFWLLKSPKQSFGSKFFKKYQNILSWCHPFCTLLHSPI